MINKVRRMNRSKKTLILFILLFFVFLTINSNWLWTLMYPIDYEEEIIASTKQFDVDPFLVLSIIQVETRFEEDKVSIKGATGLMQIMPDTANWIVKNGPFSADSIKFVNKPEINIKFGTWYLKQLEHQFNGNQVVMVAAYNAGPGNVSKWLQSGVWDGTYVGIKNIPFGETRHYIQRIFHFYERYQSIYQNKFN